MEWLHTFWNSSLSAAGRYAVVCTLVTAVLFVVRAVTVRRLKDIDISELMAVAISCIGFMPLMLLAMVTWWTSKGLRRLFRRDPPALTPDQDERSVEMNVTEAESDAIGAMRRGTAVIRPVYEMGHVVEMKTRDGLQLVLDPSEKELILEFRQLRKERTAEAARNLEGTLKGSLFCSENDTPPHLR